MKEQPLPPWVSQARIDSDPQVPQKVEEASDIYDQLKGLDLHSFRILGSDIRPKAKRITAESNGKGMVRRYVEFHIKFRSYLDP